MGRNDMFRWGKSSTSNKRSYRPPGSKDICEVCGRPIDVFHDNDACRKKWLAELDAKGNPSNTRRPS